MQNGTPEIEHVVRGGFCVGCGACAAVAPAVSMRRNDYGEIVADLRQAAPDALAQASKVCPFVATVPDEYELARDAASSWSASELPLDRVVGYHNGVYAGYSVQDRASGSSGGIATWLLRTLLETKQVDYVVRVGPTASGSGADQSYFEFQVISDPAQVATGATSFYYPVTMAKVLDYIRTHPGRYAVTGVPCFHKALRLLKRQDPVLRERITVQVGIVCGQLKSAFYLEYLARKAGVRGQLTGACFRRKDLAARADDYLFEATYRDGAGASQTVTVRNREIGANWGMGLFKPKACDYCDDVFAETADIAIMDAWLPRYVQDGAGTSLILVRDERLKTMLERARAAGTLVLDASTVADLVESQLGGLNHRRLGLSWRVTQGGKGYAPRKRVQPRRDFNAAFVWDQRVRDVLRAASRISMRAQLRLGSGLGLYDALMAAPMMAYRAIMRWKRKSRARNKQVDYTC